MGVGRARSRFNALGNTLQHIDIQHTDKNLAEYTARNLLRVVISPYTPPGTWSHVFKRLTEKHSHVISTYFLQASFISHTNRFRVHINDAIKKSD